VGPRGPDAADRLHRDTATAEGLSGRVYTDPDVWELERRSVFRRGWFAAAFTGDIPAAGDVLPVQTAGWDLVLVRRSDGTIGAFHNICRHRGMRVVTEPGNVTALRCGWHCWTYALDGRLAGTPLIGGHGINRAEGIDPDDLALVPVECGVWRDLVFVRIDRDGPSLAEHLAPLDTYFAAYDLDALCVAETGPELELPANWKLVVEGGIEGYHLPWVHPQMQQPPGYDIELGGDCFTGIASQLTVTPPADGDPVPPLPAFPHLRPSIERGEPQRFAILFVVPTAIVAVYPNHAVSTLLRPVSVERTAVRRQFSFLGDAATDPAWAPRRDGTRNAWYEVSRQDHDYAGGVQATSGPRGDLGLATRFAPHWEGGVHAFQQWVLRTTTV